MGILRQTLALLLTVGCCAALAETPNVVFILADDMGYDSVAALNPKYGLPSPHIDRLISEGMHFTDAHSGSAVCSPTRYGVLTGRYSWRTPMKRGIVGQWKPPLIKLDRLTVGDMFKERGYATACIGKWHLGWNWSNKNGKPTTKLAEVDFSKPTTGGPVDQGFDHYYGDDVPNWPPYMWIKDHQPQGNPTAKKPKEMFGSPGPMVPGWKLEPVLPEITRRSAAYIEEQAAAKKPFFLFFPMTSPHTPIAPDENFKGNTGKGDYADFMVETDWCVGQLLGAIDKAGIADNTIVVFTADNGTSPKANFAGLRAQGVELQHHFRGNKADIFEGGHRVPFVVRWPGKIKPGSKSDQTICLTDFMATAADVLDYKLPADAAEDSHSLLPVLTGKGVGGSVHEGVVNHSIDGSFAVRKGPWKLIFCRGSGGWSAPKERDALKKKLPPLQLYNLDDDPKEQTNLQAQMPEKVAELTALLRTIVDNGRSTTGPPQTNDGAAWWNKLPWKE